MTLTLEMRLVIASVIPVGMFMMLWHTLVTRRSILALKERIARQADALALLTETSEGGFEAVAKELARIRAAQQPEALRPLGPRRMASTAPQQSPAATGPQQRPALSEKAAKPASSMSEGEVHLRRLFAQQTATQRGVQAV